MGYRLARFLIHFLMRLLARLEVQGLEKFPETGSFVVAANHVGRTDVPLVFHLINRDDIILLVAEKYRESAIFRWFARQFNAIWVDRYNADFSAMRSALTRLRAGGVLVLSPEGTRSPDGTLLPGRNGGSWLAIKAGVPVIPVALVGTEDRVVLNQLRHFRRLHIQVRVGAPILPPAVKGAVHEEMAQAFTDEIMCQIAALLPPESRGFYAAHPRLLELLHARSN